MLLIPFPWRLLLFYLLLLFLSLLQILLFSVVSDTITASILNRFLVWFFDASGFIFSIRCNIIFLFISIVIDSVAVVIVHISIAFNFISLAIDNIDW